MEKPKTWGRSRAMRIKGFNYAAPGQAYHVVIGSKDRVHRFITREINQSILELLSESAQTCGYRVACACLMPDHLHLLVEAGSRPKELAILIRMYKSKCALSGRSDLWQRGFYDHVVRREDSLEDLSHYILNNPVRAGLIRVGEDWPWMIRGW
jgi:putative transposase